MDGSTQVQTDSYLRLKIKDIIYTSPHPETKNIYKLSAAAAARKIKKKTITIF